jgi:hypothetical protein
MDRISKKRRDSILKRIAFTADLEKAVSGAISCRAVLETSS